MTLKSALQDVRKRRWAVSGCWGNGLFGSSRAGAGPLSKHWGMEISPRAGTRTGFRHGPHVEVVTKVLRTPLHTCWKISKNRAKASGVDGL